MTDLVIAKKYLAKAARAEKRHLEFSISFTSFKNMMRAEYCGYTGIRLTEPRADAQPRATDRTIERIDNTKGYHSGNVIAVCNAANSLKSVFENNKTPMTMAMFERMIKVIKRRMK